MKIFISILFSALGAALVSAEELWKLTFSGKTENAITTNAQILNFSGTVSANLISLKKTTYSSGAVSDIGFMTTAGTVVGGNANLFTPNTNVQNSGSWSADFSCRISGGMVLENVVLGIVSFGSSGNTQGQTRRAEFSFSLIDSAGTTVSSGTLVQAIVNGTSPNAVTLTFAGSPLIAAGDYTMRIGATKSTETNGSYFALSYISANGQDKISDVSEPAGYVVKSIPAGKSTFISVNVQKPILVQSAAVFSTDGAGTVTLTADPDVNFSEQLDATKSYLLEVQVDAGTAVFVLNRDIWKDGQTAGFVATQNTLVFRDESLADLVNTATDAVIRIREAWTIEQIFGASFRAGELKRGNAISGDAVYVNIDDSGNAIKTYFTTANVWKGNAAYASQTNIGAIPVHPCMPLRIARKAGADCELQLVGETFSGDRLIKLNCARERLSSADAFPQVLSRAGLQLESPASVSIGSGSFIYNASSGHWEYSTNGADAGNVSVEDGVLFIRGAESPEFILFKQSTLR